MEYIENDLARVMAALMQAHVEPDGKAVADAILLATTPEIATAFDADVAAGAFDAPAFYKRWFRPVSGEDAGFQTDPTHTPLQHLDRIWSVLSRPADDPDERSTRVPLPHPYVVVGGRFQEAYYWDSYFTMRGLLRSGRTEAVRDMIENFARSITTYGLIPNGFRSYFLTRSQPPFFCRMVSDYGEATGNRQAALVRWRDAMAREYAFFMDSAHNCDGLARYWDEANTPRGEMYGADLEWLSQTDHNPEFFRDLRAACESGWDFSSRWFDDPMDIGTVRTTHILPVDLNCLMLQMEETLATAFADDTGKARGFAEAADRRRAAIAGQFFDETRGYFFDRFLDGALSTRITAAGLFPLWVGAASEAQADAAARFAKEHLLAAGGLLTTTINTGQQWDAPNGWAPLNWVAIMGLRRYGHEALADDIRSRWLATCDAVFQKSGKFVEKYDVTNPLAATGGGEYPLQDGFGWTNGVYLDLALE